MKSLDELKTLRDEEKFKLGIREEIDHHKYTQVIVAMSTCGIEAGARETLHAIVDAVEKNRLDKVVVSITASSDNCADAPVVVVNPVDGEKVTYVKVTPQKANEIIEKHVIGGNMITDYTV